MKKLIHYTSLCTILAALIATQSAQAAEFSRTLNLPATPSVNVNSVDCQNSGGPQVTVDGVIRLGSVCAKIILSNNTKGTHTTTVQKEYTVTLGLEQSVTIPKQPVRGGVGGNPHIWIQFANDGGGALSEEIYLGRCVQGRNVSKEVLTEALLNLIASTTDCSNKGGPYITLGGEMVLTSGVNAKLIFRNNLKGTHTAEAQVTVKLIAAGTKIVLPKQPSRGGVGGNPLITIQFVNCKTGAPIGDPIELGRCNQL